MSALALGFVIAVGLMAATVIYADALDDLGLDFALGRADEREINLVVASGLRLAPAEVTHFTGITEGEFDRTLGRYMRERVRYLKSGTFFPAPGPGLPVNFEDSGRPRAFLQSRSGILDHVTIEGRAPSSQGSETAIEAAVGRPAAERIGISVGDEFELYPFWDTARPALRVTVVGIYDQLAPTSDYWTASENTFDYTIASWTTYAFFVDEEALVGGVGAAYLNMPGEYTLIGRVDTASFDAPDTVAVRGAFGAYEASVRQRLANIRTTTGLPSLLSDFEARLFFSRIPLFILVIQIVGIALYYLVMVASMLVERQSGEIALLKSRGATTGQVMGVYLIEGLGLGLLALVLGPLLASLAVAQMGRTPIFNDLSGGAPLEAGLSTQAYTVALGGVLLALAALLIPAYLATRRTIVHYKQSLGRKDVQPVFFRYYFDLFFVALLGLLFFQLRQQGTLASENLFGELESDPLLLVAPAIFLVTSGVVFLRVFPLLLHGFAALFGRTSFTAPLVALWHLVRNPTHYGRLVLLLILATSLGAFAAGFGSTLNTNYGDRASYEAGADVRLSQLRPPGSGPSQLYGPMAEEPGVLQAAAVARDDVRYQVDTFNSINLDVIAFDERFQEVGFFRDDFADAGLPGIAERLELGSFTPPPGPQLPEGHNWLVLTIAADVGALGRIEFHAQVRDAAGQVRDVVLDLPRSLPLDPGSPTVELFGFLPTAFGTLEPPLEVTSLSVRRPTNLGDDRGAITFLRISSFEFAGGREAMQSEVPPAFPLPTLVEDFEDPARWEVISGQAPSRLADTITPDGISGDPNGIRLTWSERLSPFFQRGIRIAGGIDVLPIFASTSFLDRSGFSVGDSFTVFDGTTYYRMEIRGEVTYFPTIADPAATTFALADLQAFLYITNSSPGTLAGIGPSELWLRTSREFNVDSAVGALPAVPNQVVLQDDVSAGREQDPLTTAGWQGILTMSFGAILLLSAVGFVVYSYLSAQGRRLEFAILRTLGLTRMQVAGVVAFEQAIVVGVGMLAGSLVGSRLGPLLISYLGITESGEDVVPPYQGVTDYFTLLATYGTLVAVFAAATVLIIALYSRLAIHRVLRLGEL